MIWRREAIASHRLILARPGSNRSGGLVFLFLYPNMEIHILVAVTWFILPLTIWVLNLVTGRRGPYQRMFAIAVFIGYPVYVAGAFLLDAHLESEYFAFDLDGDGDISSVELTPAAEQAHDDLIADAGRAMAPIFGLPLTALWATICLYPLTKLDHWIWPPRSIDSNYN